MTTSPRSPFSFLIVFIWIVCVSCSSNSTGNIKLSGTTPGLREVFIGRCWEYQTLVNPNIGHHRNCTRLWELFSEAFMYKAPCDVKSTDFDSFLDEVQHPIPRDKIVFWSGTYQFAHQYTDNGRRMTALEDTMMGYLFDGLRWCGQKDDPGINYITCPGYGECVPKTSYGNVYWIPASKRLAAITEGVATVILNGTRSNGRPAVSENSVFLQHELPNMNPQKVALLQAYVMHSIGKIHIETCNNGSLLTLRNKALQKGLKFQCEDDPKKLFHLLCVDSPDVPECHVTGLVSGHHDIRSPSRLIFISIISAITIHFTAQH